MKPSSEILADLFLGFLLVGIAYGAYLLADAAVKSFAAPPDPLPDPADRLHWAVVQNAEEILRQAAKEL